jgi:hypothetical protein
MIKWKPYITFAILLALMDIIFAFWMMRNFGEDIRVYLKKRQNFSIASVNIGIQKDAEPQKIKERSPQRKDTKKGVQIDTKIKEERGKFWGSFKGVVAGVSEKLQGVFQTKENRALAEEREKRDQLVAEIKKRTKLSEGTIGQILQYEQRTGMPVKIVLAIMEQESSFNKDAVGTSEDRGLMQIIPETEAWLCKKYGEQFGITYDPKRIFDEDYNIALGTIYLWHLYKAYPEDYHRIFTEYNRGYYKAENYHKEKGHYMTTYSIKVMEKMKKYEDLESYLKG